MKIETSTPIISDFVCSRMYRRGMKRVREDLLIRILTFTLIGGKRIIFGNNNITHQKISHGHTSTYSLDISIQGGIRFHLTLVKRLFTGIIYVGSRYSTQKYMCVNTMGVCRNSMVINHILESKLLMSSIHARSHIAIVMC